MSGEVVVIGSKDKDDNDPRAGEGQAQILQPFFNIPVDAVPVKRAVLAISS
jgi:hypothetical protein